jgi:ribosomal-protein-alanine N-acetyltransferase
MQIRLLSRFLNQEIDVDDGSLYLRAPVASDFDQWLDVRTKSRAFLTPWEPLWPNDDLSTIGFQRRLKSYHHQKQNGTARTFFLFNRHDESLLGGISLTRITYGSTRTSMLGYWMSVDHAGKGYMRKAVPAMLDFAFTNLRLKRVEAACLPANDVSINLLKKCGFREEGYAREYLEINGRREDHILFAKIASEHQKQNS